MLTSACMDSSHTMEIEKDQPGNGTGFMINSVCIANQLKERCPNRQGHQVHKHVVLQNGRTRAAQIYPEGLCKAICAGLQEQMQLDAQGRFLLMSIDAQEDTTSQELKRSAEKLRQKYKTVEEEDDPMEMAWDDVSGAELNPTMVKAARQEEIDYVRNMHMYDNVPITECKRATGKMPITVRWIDINKGDRDSPSYRSRIVARELNTHTRDDLFAATPPLEALRVISSMTTIAN